MNCEIFRTLYIRANGEIPCNDDTGESISLGWVQNKQDWSIQQIFNNIYYKHIRTSLTDSWPPWGHVCKDCAFLERNHQFEDEIARNHLSKLQIELSLLCDLDCPCCTRIHQIQHRAEPFLMPVELYYRLISNLSEHGFKVDLIEYCGQGEPTKHPVFHTFIDIVRHCLPCTRLRLITSGNAGYDNVLKQRNLDEIYVSCDGLHQRSYEQYRRNGSVKKALNFMTDAVRARKPGGVVIWKYILFEFNDSDEEIIAAQRRALSMGVNELQFVMTHSQYRSVRFTSENIQEVPIIPKIAKIASTPQVGHTAKSIHLNNTRFGNTVSNMTISMRNQAKKSAFLYRLFTANPKFRKLRRAIERTIL